MKKSPPSPPLTPFRSSSSSPSNYAPFSSPNMIPINKSNKSKPEHVESSRRRSSIYRGVTRHRGTGRYEAHLWDKTWQNPVRKRRGRQVYLGAYNDEVDAARAHDVAALKLWGPQTVLNFPVEMYREEYKKIQTMSKEEVLASLRRRSDGFARGYAKYRGVARHHRDGRWEARLGLVGHKNIYFGTYETEEEAFRAYDLAALEHKGPNMATNFASVYKHRQWPFMQLPGNLGVEPAQEHARVVQMEATESVDQTLPNDDMLGISWTFDMDHDIGDITIADDLHFDMDHDIGACPLPDVTIADDLHGILNNQSFEENIEQLFEAFETHGGNESGSNRDGSGASEGA